MWKYMNMNLDPATLPSKDDLLARIRADGETDRALADLREEQMETYQNELIWRYPISEGTAAGGFITPVREGILWIPYDEMEREEGEILLLDEACLLTEDACTAFEEDFRYYAAGLCSMLLEAAAICRQLSNTNSELEENT